MKKVLEGISVIIPTFNRAKYLYSTLICLCNQKYSSCDYEIIIIDSGTDETYKIVNFFQNKFKVRIIYKKIKSCGNRSFIRNKGVKLSNYNILCFLDNDILTPPNFIKTHFLFHQEHNAVLVGLRKSLTEFDLSNFGEENLIKNYQNLEKLPYYYDNREKEFQNERNLVCTWRFLYSNNMSILKENFLKVKGFNKELGKNWGYEDIEFGVRLEKKDIKIIINSDLDIYHQPHFEQSKIQQPAGIANQELFIKLHKYYEIELFIIFQDNFLKYYKMINTLSNKSNDVDLLHRFDSYNMLILGKFNSLYDNCYKKNKNYELLGVYSFHLKHRKFKKCLILNTFFYLPTCMQDIILTQAFILSKEVFIQNKNIDDFEFKIKKIALSNGMIIELENFQNFSKIIFIEKISCKNIFLMLPNIYEIRFRALFSQFAVYLFKKNFDVVLEDITKIESFSNEEFGLNKELEQINDLFCFEKYFKKRIAILPKSLILQGFPLYKHNYKKIIEFDNSFYQKTDNKKNNEKLKYIFLLNNKEYFYNRTIIQENSTICCFMEEGFIEDGIDIILKSFHMYLKENPSARLKIKVPQIEAYYKKTFPYHNDSSKQTKNYSVKNKFKTDKLLLEKEISLLGINAFVEIIDYNYTIQEIINFIDSCSSLICCNRSFELPLEVYIAALLSKKILLAEQFILPDLLMLNVQRLKIQSSAFTDVFDVPINCKCVNLIANTVKEIDLLNKMKIQIQNKDINLNVFFEQITNEVQAFISLLLNNSAECK